MLSLSTQQREVSSKLSYAGTSEPLNKTAVIIRKGPEEKKDQQEIVRYKVKMNQVRLVPTWLYGLTSQWSIGVRLPFTRIEAQKITEGKRKIETQEDFLIGNVEMLNKQQVYSEGRSSWALMQRLRFPSAETPPEEMWIYSWPEPSGYAVGAGAIYEMRVSHKWGWSVSLAHDMNFEDEVQDPYSPTIRRIRRDPGDKTTATFSAGMKATEEISWSLGYIQKHKTVDRYFGSTEAEPDGRVEQRVAELGLEYAPEALSTGAKSRVPDGFSARMKYYATVQGRNIEDSDIFSVQVQFVY